MVDKIHYRWDFIGLSTDTPKPTPSTSPKVVDGSTYYEADTSKLYVWYDDQWYEKEATGGGISTSVIDTIWFGTQEAYDLIDPKAEKTLYLVQEDVETPVSLSLNSPRNIETVIERPVVVPNSGLKNTIANNIEEEVGEDTPEETTEEKE